MKEKDKFYYQQSFKSHEIPVDFYDSNQSNYPSENLVIYPGRRALHIFDVDKEKWIASSTEAGHQYEDLYNNVRV